MTASSVLRASAEPSDVEIAETAADLEQASRGVITVARQLLAPAAALLVWIYVYLIALLGGWVLLASLVAGWNPIVITSGSMEPVIRTGDVLLVSEHTKDLVAQNSVITFERDDGELIAHRVFTVVDGGYITKGDANVSPDADRVELSEAQGIGRLVVPVIGLPVLWASNGNTVPLVAWALLTFAAIIYVSHAASQEIRRRTRESTPRDEPDAVATAGIRRVRALVSMMIVIQYLIDPARFDVTASGGGREGVLIISVGVLVALNTVSARIGRRDSSASRRMAMVELTIDTMLVVFIATATGTDGIGWVLFAMPVIEAAVRFGLTGGLIHWMVLTTVTVGARIGVSETSAGQGLLIGELEAVLDQLSVLFIVVIPGAYLAEQLIGDVQRHRRATSAAVGRGELLEQVVASGHEVNRLGDHSLDALTEGVTALGYEASDVALSADGLTWRSLASHGSVALPDAGQPGSGLQPDDLRHTAVVVDLEDPDTDDRRALETAGLSRVIAITVSDGGRGRVVLRAGKKPPSTAVDAARLDALRLLAGQAAVALQNEVLLNELTSVHDELEHQATHDALTGLPNRPHLLRNVRNALSSDQDAVLLFLDLDGFKPVNDRLGHDSGDELLRIVAERLRTVTGEHGLVARLGGDEFTVLLTGAYARGRAPMIASAIHAALTQSVRLDLESVHVAVSIGLAEIEPGINEMELLRRADVAMYHAKRVVSDGSAFVRYTTELDEDEARRADLARDLLPALDDGSIRIEYQPIVFVGSGERIIGIEALVRWTHAVHGAIGPQELIQLAEDIGHCDDLQRFIVRRATRDTAALIAAHPHAGLFLTINASPAELRSAATVQNFGEAVAASGIAPESLFVEISERLVDPDEEAVANTMHALRSLGISLLLDDFGEGQTSLSFLHQLPISGIKLDRKLVVNSVRSPTERIVIESIIELSKRLDLTVIAEGIETADHVEIITATGCTIVQGFHYYPPLPLEKITTLLRHQSQPVPAAVEMASEETAIGTEVR